MPRAVHTQKSRIAKASSRNKKARPSAGRANNLSHEKRMVGYSGGRKGRY